MGAEFSGVTESCESVLVKDPFIAADEAMNDVENQIEYHLKSYLCAKDSSYHSLLASKSIASSFDARFLQHLLVKSPYTQQFSYQLLHKIFADRFNVPYRDPFSIQRVPNYILKIQANRFVVQQQRNHKPTSSPTTSKKPHVQTKNFPNDIIKKLDKTSLIIHPTSRRELIASIESAIHFEYKLNVLSKYKPKLFNKYGDHKVLHIDLTHLNSPVLRIDSSTLNVHGQSMYNAHNLILSESGSTPKRIHSVLWPKNARHTVSGNDGNFKVLSTVYDHKLDTLTIYDIISNGLQSSLSTPFSNKSLVNYVKAFQMIVIDHVENITYSRLVQIERSIGSGAITNKYKWNKRYPDIELIQDTEMFESCLCGMGLFGVVYSYYLLVEDAYFIKKSNHMISWNAFKDTKWSRIEKECKSGNIIGLNMKISPYTTFDSKYAESPPVFVCMYRKSSVHQEDDETVNVDYDYKKARVHTNCAMMVWISTVFPQLIPFLMQMMLQYQDVVDVMDAPYKTSQLAVDVNNFVHVIDDYIKVSNGLVKKTAKHKQYVTAPLMVDFGKKAPGIFNLNAKFKYSAFIKQPMCYFKSHGKGNSLVTPKMIQTLNAFQSRVMSTYNGYLFASDAEIDILQTIGKKKLLAFIACYQRFSASTMFDNEFLVKVDLNEAVESQAKKKRKRNKRKNSKLGVFANDDKSTQNVSL